MLQRIAHNSGVEPLPTLAPEAMQQLLRYNFPGNIRELQNIIERALIFCHGRTLTAGCLPRELHDLASHPAVTVTQGEQQVVRIEMAVSDSFVQPTIDAIIEAARTGNVGDGKIFVQPLDHVVRIRTGEEDRAALTPVTAGEVQSRATRAVMEELSA